MKKKIDSRIKILIENCVKQRFRSFFVIVGNDAKYQVVNLHYMLSKATVSARPNVLWCYKKELGFSAKANKKIQKIQKSKQLGNRNVTSSSKDGGDDPFQLFIGSTEIRYCFYGETEKILGNTFGMCVLQDFEAITPNVLARTIETVQGGGIVVLMLESMKSLKELYTMTMDVHSKYRTDGHSSITGRFNERFLLSLNDCDSCLVVDDQLNILSLSSPKAKNVVEIEGDFDSLTTNSKANSTGYVSVPSIDSADVSACMKLAKTSDQSKILNQIIEILTTRDPSAISRTICSLTAARGRGKSATLGLAIGAALFLGYGNIFVTSPTPENLRTFFQFVIQSLKSFGYEEHHDFDVIASSNPEFNKAVIKISLKKDCHRRFVQFITPNDAQLIGSAELVVIDEAAAIPVPLVKSFFGANLLFLASTINGYEGTGRSLSLKLIQQLREAKNSSTSSVKLEEIKLEEPIRYAAGDPVEAWLNSFLCLDINSIPKVLSGCPHPSSCELYYVDRDTLFSYHKASEVFLQRMVGLCTASHYKNTPNDLQLMCDAPAHHLFVLLPPVDAESSSLPEVLVVIQIALEGEISKASLTQNLSRGVRGAGDLIPWTLSQQFQDENFASLSGARIVRIAAHPDYQNMGYGSRALECLQQFLKGQIISLKTPNTKNLKKQADENAANDSENILLKEVLKPKKISKPLLLKLDEVEPLGNLNWLGTSFGLTPPLFKFWKRAGYAPMYIRQTTNDLTGENTCIMLKNLTPESTDNSNWHRDFYLDFKNRFISLLSFPSAFSKFAPATSLSVLEFYSSQSTDEAQLEMALKCFSVFDAKRLESYCNNMVDHHLITDLIPQLAQLYFAHFNISSDNVISETRQQTLSLSPVQSAILLAMGLQRKTVDVVENELNLPASQILAMLTKVIKKLSTLLKEFHKKEHGASAPLSNDPFEQELRKRKDHIFDAESTLLSIPSAKQSKASASSNSFEKLKEKYSSKK